MKNLGLKIFPPMRLKEIVGKVLLSWDSSKDLLLDNKGSWKDVMNGQFVMSHMI